MAGLTKGLQEITDKVRERQLGREDHGRSDRYDTQSLPGRADRHAVRDGRRAGR